MGDLINLRRMRKARARAEDGRLADQHRVQFGRTKEEKARAKALKAKADRTLDAHQRDQA